jgi:hypothetical protein
MVVILPASSGDLLWEYVDRDPQVADLLERYCMNVA